MSYGEDNFDEDRGGRYNQTSNFSTTSISKDGRFFGVKLSKETASQLNVMYSTMLSWMSSKGARVTTPHAEKFAEKFIYKNNPHAAAKFGGRAGNAVAYGIIFGKQAFEIGSNIYDSTQSLNELRSAVRPLAHAGSSSSSIAPLSGDNEVVRNARTKIKDIFSKRLMQTLTGAVATLPALIDRVGEQSRLNKKREEDYEWKKIKNDPEARALYLENKHLGDRAGMEAHELEKVNEATIKIAQKRREEKFKIFKAEKESDVVRALDHVLNMPAKEVIYRLEDLRSHGVDVSGLERTLHYRNLSEDELKEFLETNRRLKTKIAENKIRADFNHEFGNFDRNKVLQEIHELNNADDDRSHGRDKHGESKSHELSGAAKGFGAALASEVLTEKLVGKKYEKYSQPIALDRILHLRRILEQAKDHAPEQVPDMAGNGEISYTRYVHEIFQQHQRDCNRAEIGARYVENLEKARWDDSAILQLPDDQLNPYEHAVKAIAKRIKDGRMDAIALIDLVGDKNKKIVRADGRSFGPLGVKKEDAAVIEAINKVIDEKTAKLRADHKQTDAQLNEKLGDFVFSVQDLKQALESNDMDLSHRSFIFAVFGEVVGSDEQLVKKIGISKERVRELRKESEGHFTDMLDAAVKTLAEMIEADPENVTKQLKITDKEQQLISSLADQVINNGKHVADITENREDRKSIETVVANAAMVLDKGQDEKPEGFWQKLVTATRSLAQAKTEKTDKKDVESTEAMNPSAKVESTAEETGDDVASSVRRHSATSRFADDEMHRHRSKNGKGSTSSEYTQAL